MHFTQSRLVRNLEPKIRKKEYFKRVKEIIAELKEQGLWGQMWIPQPIHTKIRSQPSTILLLKAKTILDYDIIIHMKKMLSRTAKKYHITLIILFGSVGKNRAGKNSDIDLAILAKKNMSLQQELLLRKELFDVFKREIDLVFITKAPPLLLGQIAKGGKFLYGKKKYFNIARVFAIKKYLDFKPYFQLLSFLRNTKFYHEYLQNTLLHQHH